MTVDKNYCASNYLAFRFIKDENINFYDGLSHKVFKPYEWSSLTPCKTAKDIDESIKKIIEREFILGKTAIFLSGGIDSAILASYLPKGTMCYTFKCIAIGAVDETNQAKKYCDMYELNHKIIEMHWSDFEELTPLIIKNAGVPVHSIEIQIYKAAMQAQKDGFEKIIIGENSDSIFGGLDRLLSKDWSFDEWVNRYTFLDPKIVLKESVSILDTYESYRVGEGIDFLKFIDDIFGIESSTSYMHAFQMVGIDYLAPYSFLRMAEPIDLNRVRNNEPKYLIQELFRIKYPNMEVPKKIAMPRATEQWLKDWCGPKRKEFKDNCIINLTGDQKWLVYCLELFLNINEQEKR